MLSKKGEKQQEKWDQAKNKRKYNTQIQGNLFESIWDFTHFEFPSYVFFMIDLKMMPGAIIQWNIKN